MTRVALIAGSAVLALSVLLLPWFELDEHVASGWDATWLARLALLAALATIVAARAGAPPALLAGLSAIALVLVAVRLAWPPDFGFGFDGLDVPVEQRVGGWVALGGGLVALAASGAARARA